ncbi:TRAP transporter small permease [Thioclava kandeliae]|uniref:TRAP transporter small permease protein n=1 Tax=Thioclava kandeliae TaxID=3070818 RepID=A0ABV1SDS3_9RHOB
MQTLINGARRILGFLAGLSMALVFAIIFINSLRRYLVGQSVPWGEELPIYLTIYGVMFGLALAYLNDNHIRFTILVDMISRKSRETLYLFVDVITFVSGLLLAYAGHSFAMKRGKLAASGLKSTGNWLAQHTGIDALVWVGKVGTWQYAIAIGGALLAVAAVLKFIERLGTLRSL